MRISIRRDKAIVRFKDDSERLDFLKSIAHWNAKITDRVGDANMWLEVFRNAEKRDKAGEGNKA